MILGLNSEQDRRAAIDFARKAWSYPVLLDAQQVSEQYGVRGLPTTVLIDREGKIVGYHLGYGSGMEKRLEQELLRQLEARTSEPKASGNSGG